MTVREALISKCPIQLGSSLIDTIIIDREINPDDVYTSETSKTNAFNGAIADMVIAYLLAPNVSEGGVSISVTEKEKILNYANSIYTEIGENTKALKPKPTAQFIQR